MKLREKDIRMNRALGWEFRCPKCRRWMQLIDDQFYGRSPVMCPKTACDWRGHYDFSELLVQVCA